MNDLGMELTKSKKKKKIPVYFRISFNACLIFWSNFVTVWDNRLISKSLSVRCLITTKLRNIFISRHNLNKKAILTKHFTAQKMKFSIKDLFSKCDQIGRKLRIWSHLLKKSLMENFIFCAVFYFIHHCCTSHPVHYSRYSFKVRIKISMSYEKCV